MPISHEHKLVFVHIPKNAGTSITKAFNMVHEGHHQIQEYSQILDLGYKSFCIVRNPWDRVVSCYEYAKMDLSFYHSIEGDSIWGKHVDYDKLKGASFEECVALLESGELKHQGWGPQHVWSHTRFVSVDEVIKLEELGDSLYGVSIKTLNTSPNKGYKSYYTPELFERVGKIYKDDILLFDYDY